MAKKPKRRKGKSGAFPPPIESSKPTRSPGTSADIHRRPMRWDLIGVFLFVSIIGSMAVLWMRPRMTVPRYTYQVMKTYPHDAEAFTQGVVWEDGLWWESTGRYGESSLRTVELETGKITKQTPLPEDLFGEGLAKWNDQLIQLTWKKGRALLYDTELNKTGEHRYEGHGWGLTHNGQHLILSDGTPEIRFLDPDTFEVVRTIWVRQDRRSVSQLNELEFVNGNIYANCWPGDLIYEIRPDDGQVTAVIDLSGLWPTRQRPPDGVLNGIAFNPKTNRLMVTGKLCPKIFEIELVLESE